MISAPAIRASAGCGNFAVDRLKIDRSFMTSLVDCSDDRAIAAAIIAMSRSLAHQRHRGGRREFPAAAVPAGARVPGGAGVPVQPALPAADAHNLLRRAAETTAGTRTQRLRSLIG